MTNADSLSFFFLCFPAERISISIFVRARGHTRLTALEIGESTGRNVKKGTLEFIVMKTNIHKYRFKKRMKKREKTKRRGGKRVIKTENLERREGGERGKKTRKERESG